MALSAGDKLGPYEILSPLGAEGMGEVYKARDTRLDRSVAIKVLPDHIAQRADLRARFEREARAVASLNHPHICVLYDVGSQDGTTYMVMELLEGETLAARIRRSAIPVEQALALAAQIGDALDRAHRAGVTHRDVKPSNIMLTRDGAKLLDFGLSKSAGSKVSPSEETLTATLTTEGTAVGTPQYMAPEQFEGREADARTDIWAFGEVLYEMLTARKAFQGKSYAGLVGAILAADPPPMAVTPFTPAWLERLVKRCLQKDPEDRYQSMRDVVLDLRAPLPETPGAKPTRWFWPAAGIACLAAAVAGWALRPQKPAAPALPAAFEVNPPEGGRFVHTPPGGGGSAISPDGNSLAFAAAGAKGETLLHVRSLESLAPRALPGTDGAELPFWSPDSRSLGFVAGGKLKRIDMSGGPPITLAEAVYGGGSWNEEGVILFGTRTGLQRIAAAGGTTTPVAKLEAGHIGHAYPRFLPGGQQFLYLVVHLDPAKNGIYGGSLNGMPATQILQTRANASYDSSSGRLLYVQEDGALMARRLEFDPPRVTGDASLVAAGTAGSYGAVSYADFSVSSNGTLFYGRRTGGGKVRFAWRDRAGKVLETIGEPYLAGNSTFEISLDGSRVAYAVNEGVRWDTWILDLSHGRNTRFTFNAAIGPRWTPDGKDIYLTNSSGLWRKAADGSGEEESVLKSATLARTGGVSPDGRYLLYETKGDIWLLPLSGERKPVAYLQNEFQGELANHVARRTLDRIRVG